jgi:putative inorganic carbon (HCO3(-)) transporter
MFGLLLILIFLRPFISSLAFPILNSYYLLLFFVSIIAWFANRKPALDSFTKIKLPLFLFFIWLTLAALLSCDKPVALSVFFQYLGGLALFLFCANLSDEEKKKAIYTLLACGILISCLAIRQYFWGFKLLDDFVAKQGLTDQFLIDCLSSRRVFMPFTTANMLAGYLAMLIGLSLAVRQRLLFIVFLLPALLLTRSMGGLISLSFGLTAYAFFKKWPAWRWLVLSAILAAILFSVAYFRLNTGKEYLDFDFSFFTRLGYWKDTFDIILHHPFTGVGLGSFSLTYSRYAHNIFLQLWAEMGLVGIISFLWLIVAVFAAGLRSKTNSEWKSALACASIIFLMHNFVDFSFFLPETAFIWWAVLGLFYQAE